MNATEEQEIKKEFQLERIILFSDAVFAIIITIMVIEIKLPEGITEAGPEQLESAFRSLWPKFIAYLISFGFIAMFWMRHVKIFSFLKDYNTALLILNLLFLFFLSLFPATLSFVSGAIRPKAPQYSWGFNLYLGVALGCLFMQSLLVNYIVKYKEYLCIQQSQIEQVLQFKVLRTTLYVIPAVALVIAVLNYFNLPFYISVLPMALIGAVSNYTRKKHYPNEKRPLSYLSDLLGTNKNPQPRN